MKYRFFRVAILGILLGGCSHKTETSAVKLFLVKPLNNSHAMEDWYPPTHKALLFYNEKFLNAINGKDISESEEVLTFKYKSNFRCNDKLRITDRNQTEMEIAVVNFYVSELEKWQKDIIQVT